MQYIYISNMGQGCNSQIFIIFGHFDLACATNFRRHLKYRVGICNLFFANIFSLTSPSSVSLPLMYMPMVGTPFSSKNSMATSLLTSKKESLSIRVECQAPIQVAKSSDQLQFQACTKNLPFHTILEVIDRS